MPETKRQHSRVLHREPVAKNVYLYVVQKPEGFTFRPGQAVELAVDQPGWRDDKHPFTMTSLPDNPRLEFIIKSYPVAQNPKHDGMTEHLGRDIEVGDSVLFGETWGAIEYQGPGVLNSLGANTDSLVFEE